MGSVNHTRDQNVIVSLSNRQKRGLHIETLGVGGKSVSKAKGVFHFGKALKIMKRAYQCLT